MTVERKAALRRWDDDIERLQEEITTFDRQLTEDRAALDSGGEVDLRAEEIGHDEADERPEDGDDDAREPVTPRPRVKKRRSKK
jgi:hypothetical protein